MLLASLSLETSKCSSFSGHFEYENYSTTPPKQDDLRVNPYFLSSMGPIFHTSSQNTPPQARTEQPHSTSPQMNTHILPTSPIAESAKAAPVLHSFHLGLLCRLHQRPRAQQPRHRLRGARLRRSAGVGSAAGAGRADAAQGLRKGPGPLAIELGE